MQFGVVPVKSAEDLPLTLTEEMFRLYEMYFM